MNLLTKPLRCYIVKEEVKEITENEAIELEYARCYQNTKDRKWYTDVEVRYEAVILGYNSLFDGNKVLTKQNIAALIVMVDHADQETLGYHKEVLVSDLVLTKESIDYFLKLADV